MQTVTYLLEWEIFKEEIYLFPQELSGPAPLAAYKTLEHIRDDVEVYEENQIYSILSWQNWYGKVIGSDPTRWRQPASYSQGQL